MIYNSTAFFYLYSSYSIIDMEGRLDCSHAGVSPLAGEVVGVRERNRVVRGNSAGSGVRIDGQED
ncbi:hypothetical protein [Methanoculleus sp. UBA303]|jgi:hypothetical protein|uniref:hypothetical protein n=1 Tax=Methanoculleus sp. UBA303 TaxID=1915497 RepID=UPI0025EAC1B9|nr:hypothetical protein [Methanoculleus sp. UBA303]MDD3933796.1 hypothetical protein [Methanoculleus sp.]